MRKLTFAMNESSHWPTAAQQPGATPATWRPGRTEGNTPWGAGSNPEEVSEIRG
jgi:hypothetical protein